MEVQLKDLREEDYTDLPEPPAPPGGRITSRIPDNYLDALESYIYALCQHIRKIQLDEANVMQEFAKTLKGLYGEKAAKKNGAEEEAKRDFFEALEKLRKQRRLYRKMKQDALMERQNLLNSMALQNEDEELLRQKLFKLGALPEDENKNGLSRASFDPFGFVLVIWQIALLIIWAFVVRFGNYNYPTAADVTSGHVISDFPGSRRFVGDLAQGYKGFTLRADDFYTFFSHISLMVFLGFGLLGSFLKKYGFSSLGYTFLFGAVAFQWVILNNGFWWNVNETSRDSSKSFTDIRLTFDVVINGLYGAATVVISLGVLIGKVRPLELFVITILETIFYSFNRYINILVLEAIDLGGSISIHTFGAYFGLAASILISRPYANSLKNDYGGRRPDELGSTHTSDLFALIGTLILWVFFPSFNGALAPNGTQYRAIINTILGLSSSAVIAFLVSRTYRRRLFDIRDIQNATIAGGVALGSVHSILIQPGAALLVGAVAAACSVLATVIVQPYLERKSAVKVFDTRGVHNTHGIPGIIGALAGIVAASIADSTVYGQSLQDILFRNSTQGGFQAAALGITLGISLASGFLVGLLIYGVRILTGPMSTEWYSDEVEFVVPTDFETKYYAPVSTTGTV